MTIIHIVGINTFIKDDMIKKFEELNYKILDLDMISKEIIFKSDNSGKIWKNKLNQTVNIFISENTNNNIIILGLNSFVMDHRYKINIPTEHKYFLNIPYDVCASQLISYNIDIYYTNIIDGIFPIKYLDHDFLMSQRKELQEEYINMNYKLITLDMLMDIVKNYFKNSSKKVYLAFIKRFEDKIPESYFGSKPIIIGYKDKWMALASILPKSSINRGIIKNKTHVEPYLKELHLNAFTQLKKPCYIYEFNGDMNLDDYRCEINDSQFTERIYVSNIYDELIRQGVTLDEFKF